MKTCSHCGAAKAEHDFYAQPKAASGLMSKCKECHKAAVKLRARTNPAVQAYDRERYKLPHRKEFGAFNARRWRKNNPERYKAQTALNNAVRDKRIFKQPCVECGTTENLHAHHHDYSKPLDVTWYCALHHHRHHHE